MDRLFCAVRCFVTWPLLSGRVRPFPRRATRSGPRVAWSISTKIGMMTEREGGAWPRAAALWRVLGPEGRGLLSVGPRRRTQSPCAHWLARVCRRQPLSEGKLAALLMGAASRPAAARHRGIAWPRRGPWRPHGNRPHRARRARRARRTPRKRAGGRSKKATKGLLSVWEKLGT